MDHDVDVYHGNFMQYDLNMPISNWSTLNFSEIKPNLNQSVTKLKTLFLQKITEIAEILKPKY